jgi:hypothetical protein
VAWITYKRFALGNFALVWFVFGLKFDEQNGKGKYWKIKIIDTTFFIILTGLFTKRSSLNESPFLNFIKKNYE